MSVARAGLRAAAVSLLAALLAAGAPAQTAPPEVVQTMCQACHGLDGNAPVSAFPQLAGQRPEYLQKQLEDFLAKRRVNDAMAPALEALNKGDIPAVAAYYATQKPKPAGSSNERLLAEGKALYDDGNTATGVPACVGCHLAGGVGNERYPRLAGQFPEYAVAQMKAFKSGARSNDKGKVMRAVAARLSEQEMAAVAEYLAAQP